jgi:hypothetical protein
VFPKVIFHGETPKIIVHILKNRTYENVYRPESAGTGEHCSVTTKLLSKTFVLKELLCKSAHTAKKIEHILRDFWRFCGISKFLAEPLLRNTELYYKICNRIQAIMD